jgi:thioredoxin reductase (NADPH)
VQVIHRRDELRASAALQKEAFSNPKLKFLWHSVVTEVLGESKVRGVRVKDLQTGRESEIDADGLFVAIGYDPNTEAFRGQLELDKKGYVKIVNETETSIPGVFAAGEVHDYKYRQAITAAADGCKALLDAERFVKRKVEKASPSLT